MSKNRVILTQKQYDEIIESRNWAKKNGFVGFSSYYDDYVEYMVRRKAFPASCSEMVAAYANEAAKQNEQQHDEYDEEY